MQNKQIYSCSIDQEKGILVKTYYGIISLDLMKKSWLQLFQQNEVTSKIKGIILDYQDAELTIDVSDLENVINFYKDYFSHLKDCRIALVSNKPKNLVLPVLIENFVHQGRSKPFSTFEAAQRWLLK